MTRIDQPTRPTSARRSRLARWLGLTAGLSAGIVAAEYLLNAVLNPEVAWSWTGVAAHMALDLGITTPIVALALGLGLALARRLGLTRDESSGLLGSIGVVGLTFVVLMLPVTASRDLAHEWFGTTYGFSLAEIQTTVVTSDLTVQEATQLCSFASVRSPSLVRDDYGALQLLVGERARSAARDVVVQLGVFLPLLLLGLGTAFRRELPEWSSAPFAALASSVARPVRMTAFAALPVVVGLVATSVWQRDAGAFEPAATGGAFNACTDGGPVKEYDVSAIDVTLTLNRWGDHVIGAHMYALDARIPEIRDFEADLAADRALPEGIGVTRVSAGLRKDPIQPLVIRANLGECLRINFTNSLSDGEPASMHILGLPHTMTNAGSAVGNNPDSMADPGQTVTYEIPIPLDPNAERAYYFHDHGAGRRRQNMGLFGAIAVEPREATYLDVETGDPLDTVTGNAWEAIIIDPNVEGRPDGKSFREFVLFYHEIGDEAFTDIRDRDGKLMPLIDDIAGIYRPAARALNYRSEPFRHRIQQDQITNGEKAGNGKSLGYASYPFGDPATPIPRSYVGEAVKTRLLHGGSEVFHVHHLHGGGDRWRRNPDADPNSDFWKGLAKVPDPNLTSIHLDSQSIGPGTSYNLEHECGAGGCQQAVGDFLYHCHIGHHYIAGMWSFWRVFGTTQTEETNLHGRPLAVIPDLFQSDNPFTDEEAPSNAPPEMGVPAGQLIGLVVDGGRTIVADANLTDPSTQIGLRTWIQQQLPPRGVPFDNNDATVWDWTATGSGANLRVFGEPESETPFPGWVSETPGERPEVLFNPKNGRYTWPLFRPQVAQRPPFSARHSGAPWLGEDMMEGRIDGLCARNGVHPAVDVGPAVTRYYPVSAITLPIQVTPDKEDPNGQIFVLNEQEADIRRGDRPAEPLAIRSNVGDCVEIILTNKIPDGELNKDFSKVNIHSHFVQFDPQASDGVITGMSYEQSVRPLQAENRRLTAPVAVGDRIIDVNHTERLRPGIWVGIGLGQGTCGVFPDGQPRPCTELRKITAISTRRIALDRPLSTPHAAGEPVGVEFVRYRWYSDVDFGTVFFHTHVEFKDWDHGLFGAHVVEPSGSTYHDPQTGEEVRAGTLVDVHVDPAVATNPVADGVDGSFREFMMFLHNNSTVEGRFTQGGGTINLRAEPWRLREGDAAYRFSSVQHGDPHTQTIQAYLGDPVVVRGMGLVDRVGGVRFTGHRFHIERRSNLSDTRDGTFIGISERFDVSLEGGAGGVGGQPGDYLYYSTLGRDFESGAWGLLRVYDTLQDGLLELPDRDPVPTGDGFPELSETGEAPPSLGDGPGAVCPPEANVVEYNGAIGDVSVTYNPLEAPDPFGVAYQPAALASDSVRTPMVIRVNAGECLRINLRNDRSVRSSISLGELDFDPQRSYGAAIGLNYDSTVAPGEVRTYEYYADRELGLVLALNLGDVDSIERGAWAGVVVEPEGSTYFRPGTETPLPGGGRGIQADIVDELGGRTREFVALFSDEDRQIGQSAMPYPVAVERFAGINYNSEPLDLRDMDDNPADVFNSSIWGDPQNVVTVPAGTPLVYRVGQPWGQQAHVPTLEGHRWLLEPGLEGSEQVFNDVLVPGMSLDLEFVGGAGGDIAAPGDYLFLDRRQPFLEKGLWHILRVTADGVSGGVDRIAIVDFDLFDHGGERWMAVLGRNGIRPAGDTASAVRIHAGGVTNGTCEGALVGRAAVHPGTGAWRLEMPLATMPDEICVRSTGGGIVSTLLP